MVKAAAAPATVDPVRFAQSLMLNLFDLTLIALSISSPKPKVPAVAAGMATVAQAGTPTCAAAAGPTSFRAAPEQTAWVACTCRAAMAVCRFEKLNGLLLAYFGSFPSSHHSGLAGGGGTQHQV